MNESEIFNAAVKLSAAERGKFLDLACKDDPILREQVNALIKAHFDSATFLHDTGGKPADRRMAETLTQSGAVEHPGTIIAGRYKLLEPIGEGGMGSVWLAEQKEPVKRKVAIKLIKAGMDSKSVLARFEAERQALAMMDHPNIAKVFDGGMTDQGRPYFVMEFVKGVPLTEYCDQARLSLKERLNLFTPVCQAIQHAHQKGIIHRDLKPSNILACLYDGQPVPKVIDFGLAKAMHQSLTDQSLHTAHGMMVGTPLYMSPEQAEHNNLDVDTRTDIYSLGVILYELLTGSTPLEKQQLKAAAVNEILRLIKEVEPQKPSTRLSGSDSLPSVAAQRSIDPNQLRKSLVGDLDWIVMKALDKERSRRYETANGLARDIDRFLNDEAVKACPPSAAYKLRKYFRRNRGKVIAAATVLAVLLLGIAGTTWGMFEARYQAGIARKETAEKETARQRESERAEGERLAKLDAQKQQARAEVGEKLASERLVQVEAEKDRAENEKQIAQSVRDFLQNKLLGQAEILQTVGNTYCGIGSFDVAIGLLERSHAMLRTHLGQAHPANLLAASNLAIGFQKAGHPEKAQTLLEESLEQMKRLLEPDHPDLLNCVSNLAVCYLKTGKFEQALSLLEENLTTRRAKQGVAHRDTLINMANLAGAYLAAGQLDKAMPLFEETLQLMRVEFDANDPVTLSSMNDLALGYLEAGMFDLALPLFEEALKLRKTILGPDHPETLMSMHNLAACYNEAGKFELAMPLLEDTISRLKQKVGADHPATLECMTNLANSYLVTGQIDKALPLLIETVRLRKARFGHDDRDTLVSMSFLASAYQEAGQRDKALPILEETFGLAKKVLGADDPETLVYMGNLAMGYHSAGQLDKALPLMVETLELKEARLGPNDPRTAVSISNLASGYKSAGQLDKAIPLLEKALSIFAGSHRPDHPLALVQMNNLASAYQDSGELDKALKLYEEGFQLSKAAFGLDHPSTLVVMKNLGMAYFENKQANKASPLLTEFIATHRKRSADDDAGFAAMLAQISIELLKYDQFPLAEPLLRECLAIREKLQPDEWTTFNSMSMLGGSLLGLNKYADAEPLLIAGYEGMKQREHLIPAQGRIRFPEALNRLVELYTQWHAAEPDKGHDAKAAEWQQILDEYKAAEKRRTSTDH